LAEEEFIRLTFDNRKGNKNIN